MNQPGPPAECSCVFQRLKLYSLTSALTLGTPGRAASWLDVCHKRALLSTGLSQSLVLQFRFASNSSFIVLLRSLQRAGLSGVCPTPRPKIGSYERIQNPASKLPVTPPLEQPRGAKAWAPARLHPSPPPHPTPTTAARACTSQATTRGWKRRCAWRPSDSQWTIATEDFKCGGGVCALPGGAGGHTNSRCCEGLWAAVSGCEPPRYGAGRVVTTGGTRQG